MDFESLRSKSLFAALRQQADEAFEAADKMRTTDAIQQIYSYLDSMSANPGRKRRQTRENARPGFELACDRGETAGNSPGPPIT